VGTPKNAAILTVSPPKYQRRCSLHVEVINDFDFPQAEKLLRFALPAARRIAAVKTRLRNAASPRST
jgi:hypothetical protein